jgi:type I restriction enzyme S subunit
LRIDAPTHKLLSRSVVKSGDVLISIAGTVGRVAVVPADAPEMNCNQAVAILRPAARCVPTYLMTWLKSRDAQRQMSGLSVQSTIKNLSLTKIRAMVMPLPDAREQKEFLRDSAYFEAAGRKAQGELTKLGNLKRQVLGHYLDETCSLKRIA